MKKMKPIPFSTKMVCAIIDGRKTQTRRVINPQPPADYKVIPRVKGDSFLFALNATAEAQLDGVIIAPKYRVGDILYVREPFAEVPATAYAQSTDVFSAPAKDKGFVYVYKAGWERCSPAWKSGRFMPREAARIFLRVTRVRVERVNDISEEDAIAEGAILVYDGYLNRCCVDSFMCLWHDINAKRGFGWDVNPWVWVYNFDVEKIIGDVTND